MDAKQLVPAELIANKIYLIRGHKVMLDIDLALLYGVETRALNQAVRRNIERFPSDLMLSLTREEIRNISQIVICSKIKHAKNVYAFTEQGGFQLSTICVQLKMTSADGKSYTTDGVNTQKGLSGREN